jgi:nickel transport protein
MPHNNAPVRFFWIKRFFGFALAVFLFLVVASPLEAHRVTIFAWVEGDTVYTESKFPGGKKVNKGKIIVYDLKGNRLLEGTSNAQGEFAFKIPEKRALRIVLQAGVGHRAEWIVPLEEIKGITADSAEALSNASTGAKETAKQVLPSPMSNFESNDVERIVEEALDRKLKPIIKILMESRDRGPTLKDILGGIGYILGLVGVASYFHYRRKKTDISDS